MKNVILFIILMVSLSVLLGCAGSSHIDMVKQACSDGKIKIYRERKEGTDLAFSCYEAKGIDLL